MFKNFMKISFRHLWKYKSFSVINIFGLTIGTICCLHAVLYVTSQSGYDVHHKDARNIYRITTEVTEPKGTPLQLATSSPPVAESLRQDFAEVEASTRLFKDIGVEQYLFKTGDRSFFELKGYYADPSFFDVFAHNFIEGSPVGALKDPYSVVMSKQVAQKLFGDVPATDRTITINNNLYKVTGVFDDSGVKSHIRARFIMSFQNAGIVDFIRTSNEWVGQNLVYTYVRISPGTEATTLEQKLPGFLQRHAKEQFDRMQVKIKKTLHLQPVTAIHLTSQMDSELEKNANPSFMSLVMWIAGLIQLMACINFMNLTTARFSNRAKEIGVRKSVGATKQSIIARFFGESLLLTGFSVLLALPIVWWTIPYLNESLTAEIDLTLFRRFRTYLYIAGLILITGFLAGSYPAFFLSGYKPAAALKGKIVQRSSSLSLRKGLVLMQFIVSIALIMAVFIISRQVSFLQKRELGFERHQKIVFPFSMEEAKKQQEAFAHELNSVPQIDLVGGASYYPSRWLGENISVFYQGKIDMKGTGVWINRVNDRFIHTLGISLIAGRNLIPADSTHGVLVNVTTLKELTIPLENAVGSRLSFQYREHQQDYTIVGVVKDFNFRSLKEPMRPLMMMWAEPDKIDYLIADVNTAEISAVISRCESIWKKLIPEVPFEYSFLEDDLRQQYQADSIFLAIINNLTFIAISIACLGLFSLAAFTAEQRTKEISIRKVMGASIRDVIILLSSDYFKLVIVAVIASIPLAWHLMEKWLQNFAYRIQMEWWMFALAGLSALMIAGITICFQTVKAAFVNPANSLRTD